MALFMVEMKGRGTLGGIHHLQLQEVKTKGPRQYLQSLQAQEVV